MPLSELKPGFKNKKIAFGKSGRPLGQRDDLDDLAIIAIESGNRSLIELFTHLPDIAELKRQRVEAQLTAKNLRVKN